MLRQMQDDKRAFSASTTMLPRELSLNCIVFEGQPSYKHLFSIQIAAEHTVELLKEAIKNKKRKAFQNIDADDLELWSVSIPRRTISEARLHELTTSLESLDPLEELGRLFPDTPPKDLLHIIVQPPHTAGVS